MKTVLLILGKETNGFAKGAYNPNFQADRDRYIRHLRRVFADTVPNAKPQETITVSSAVI